ncbi:hypothetical protein ASF39_19670 [Methylobacterium sp. Leaf108]|nr:hypothetical protein ASF39_19670 [Methylobacterium sp. Leaf108]
MRISLLPSWVAIRSAGARTISCEAPDQTVAISPIRYIYSEEAKSQKTERLVEDLKLWGS